MEGDAAVEILRAIEGSQRSMAKPVDLAMDRELAGRCRSGTGPGCDVERSVDPPGGNNQEQLPIEVNFEHRSSGAPRSRSTGLCKPVECSSIQDTGAGKALRLLERRDRMSPVGAEQALDRSEPVPEGGQRFLGRDEIRIVLGGRFRWSSTQSSWSSARWLWSMWYRSSPSALTSLSSPTTSEPTPPRPRLRHRHSRRREPEALRSAPPEASASP